MNLAFPGLLTAAAVLALVMSPLAHAAADRIFLNARAYTVNAAEPWAEAVAVTGDTIVYVGDNEGAKALVGETTVLHDLGGQMLLPGFIDAHMHPLSGGGYARALSLDTWGTVEDWLNAVGEFVAANPGDGLLFGYGFLATTFGPEGPTRQQLDAIAADRPILIMDEGFHGAWANSAALRQLGINRETPDPVPGFSYYKRDAKGEPTGYLLEGTAIDAMDALGAITPAVIVDGTAYVFDVLNAYGVTSVFDAGALEAAHWSGDILAELETAGHMSVRIVGSHFVTDLAAAETAVADTLAQARELRGERYHYNTLKIMLDGTVEGRTAAMFEDYQGEPGNRGELVFSQEQVTAMVTEAAAAGVDVHLHGLGERAVHQGLNAIEAARRLHPDSASRFTITHVQVITDEDLPRFAALDVIAQSTPLWASYDVYGEQFVSEDQFNRFWRFHSLEQTGARLTWGSDYPASGAGMLGMSPLVQMQIGMTRQALEDPDAPIQPDARERLSLPILIRGFTLEAAYQLHREDEIGSIEVGKKADLVVLQKNLFEVPVTEIHTVPVTATYVDGRQVYGDPISPAAVVAGTNDNN
ncbi:amidohydrolase [Seongchinamella unica]|uniref:Amidohydrolase n=1 Tax=Seongchinamella unica TaxID=2547392 RepID=A0A4R5LVP8_9GAMM|nr:amidohydrolase [Seongchinamella unica]TDG15437.1 amidohydrolase [Seongchinamella unica]